jgi:hypothetical protein
MARRMLIGVENACPAFIFMMMGRFEDDDDYRSSGARTRILHLGA